MSEIISFELAKKAKSIGFNDPTNHFYYKDGVLDNGDGDWEFISFNHNIFEGYYSAPTLDEYRDWINKNYNDNIGNRTQTE